MNLDLSIGTLRGGVPIQFIWPVTQSKEIRDKNLFKVKKITVYSKIVAYLRQFFVSTDAKAARLSIVTGTPALRGCTHKTEGH